MKFVSAISEAAQRVISGESVDPRIPQALCVIPILTELALRSVILDTPALTLELTWCLLLIGIAGLGAEFIDLNLLPAGWSILLPVIDIMAIGIAQTTSDGTGIGVAVVWPAVWLGLQYHRRGVAVAVVAVAVAMAFPLVVENGVKLETLSRSVQLMIMAITCSAAVSVTSRMWSEQRLELRQSQFKLQAAVSQVVKHRALNQAVLSSVDVGLLSLDRHGRYTTVNPRLRQIIAHAYPDGHAGYAGQLGDFFHEDGRTPLTAEELPTARAVRGEEFSEYTIWIGKDGGTREAYAVSARSLKDRRGEFDGAVVAFHDVTERMHAIRIKDDFVASVSHELRTPLTSILGYVDVILEDVAKVPETARHHLEIVQRNSLRLLRLVDDLLQVEQQSEGVALDINTIDLARILTEAVDSARPKAEVAGLALGFEFAPVPPMRGDAQRLAQVFDNLISNAIKYTERNGQVKVALAQEGEYAVVRVQDSGMGIASTDRSRLFSRFFRSAEAEQRAIPGIGLGLAICKAIVEGHGGRIDVDSEVGQGATFEVWLPL